MIANLVSPNPLAISSTKKAVHSAKELCPGCLIAIIQRGKRTIIPFILDLKRLLRFRLGKSRQDARMPRRQHFLFSPYVKSLEVLDSRKEIFATYVDLCDFLSKDFQQISSVITKAFLSEGELSLETLKTASSYLRYTNNGIHLFEKLITEFDKNVSIARAENFSSAYFVDTHGYGQYSLWAHRILVDQHSRVFEKIYTNSFNKKAFLFFYDHLYERLAARDIRPPRLLHIPSAGDKLQAIYFEKADHHKVGMARYIDRVFDISLGMYSIDIKELPKSPSLRTDFRYDFQYRQRRTYASAALQRLRPENDPMTYLEFLEQEVNKLPKQLAHSDLGFDNLSADNTVFDWDDWAVYPIGFDIARSLYRYRLTSDVSLFDNLVQDKCKGLIAKDEWNLFNASIKYFLFVFYSAGICGEDFDLVLADLLNSVETLLAL